MLTTGQKKRFTTIFFLVIMCTAFITLGTYMGFAAGDSVDNEMAFGRHSVIVTEEYDPPGPLYPGAEVDKVVSFTNVADYGALIRVKYDEFWTAKTGVVLSNLFYDETSSSWLSATDKNWNATSGFGNTTLWSDGGDGYYYYNKVLPAGESTDPVLDSIMLNGKLLDSSVVIDYAGGDYKLTFVVESVVRTASSSEIQSQFGSHVSASVDSSGNVTWSFA